MAADPCRLTLAIGDQDRDSILVDLLEEHHSIAATKGRHEFVLPAYAYRWYRIGGLDYIQHRADA
jgi:maltose alpha-D-glucosyltransferase/alpha-amylase